MKLLRFLSIALVATGLSASLFAQGATTTGSVYGRVTDETGGVLPGVTVTLAGVGAPRTTTTGPQGDFRFVNLSPGTYSLKSELSG
ncbi:MAG: carboxypeptidase-like regulatory domain-containing protein, partial [Acidobacteriota bacterium]|nr:carboxypeptidase-like regulatory domain-containing protein [Acidobacteriota bacterium]